MPPTDFLAPEQTRTADVKYFLKEREELLLEQTKMMARAKEMFGPLIK